MASALAFAMIDDFIAAVTGLILADTAALPASSKVRLCLIPGLQKIVNCPIAFLRQQVSGCRRRRSVLLWPYDKRDYDGVQPKLRCELAQPLADHELALQVARDGLMGELELAHTTVASGLVWGGSSFHTSLPPDLVGITKFAAGRLLFEQHPEYRLAQWRERGLQQARE